MDLRSYLGPLKRKLWLIVLVTLVAASGAAAWTLRFGETSYAGELYVTIGYTDDQATPDYKYGNYYANFSAIEFARTSSAWVQSGSFIDRVYSSARVDAATDAGLLGRLFGPISSKRVERANIVFELRSRTQENAERLLAALREEFARAIVSYNAASASKYVVVNPQARVDAVVPNPRQAAGLGGAVGLLLGIVLAYLVEFAAGTLASAGEVEELLGCAPDFQLSRRDPQLGAVLAARTSALPSSPLLVGVTLDPSGLALSVARALHRQGVPHVTLVEGQRRLRASQRSGLRRDAKGWSDALAGAKGTVKLGSKLLTALQPGIDLAAYGSGHGAAIGRVLDGAPGQALGLVSFPSGAQQLADLPAATPLLVVLQLGTSRSRDVQHLRSFIGGRPATVLLLS